jgi:hypothetical protein
MQQLLCDEFDTQKERGVKVIHSAEAAVDVVSFQINVRLGMNIDC